MFDSAIRRAARTVAVLGVVAGSLAADQDADIAERMRPLFASEMKRHAIPSIAVAVVDGDRILWTEAFGYEDAEHSSKATVRTRYRIGSVGKAINALAILMSDCASNACLDRPLSELDEQWSFEGPGSSPVTLRALLSHSAGIQREPPVGFYLQSTRPSLEATVKSLEGTCRLFEPDTNQVKYSNAGVTLAGAALEKLSGMDYADAIHALVFEPAGMARAELGVPLDTAHAVRRRNGSDVTASRFPIGMTPAGDMVASASDMASLMRHIFRALDGKESAFERGVVNRMVRPFGDLAREDWHMEVGLGLVLNGKFEGARLARHGGGVYGFSTEFALLPEQRLGVAVMSAREGSLSVAQNLAHHILRTQLAARSDKPGPGFKPAGRLYEKTEAELSRIRETPTGDIPEDWRELIGFYGWEHGGIEILSDGRSLFASVEGGPPDSILRSNGELVFGKFDNYAREFVRFVRNGEGRVIGLAIGAGCGAVLPRSGVDESDLPTIVSLPCPG